MRIWDDKDAAIVATVFNSIAPNSIAQRADLLVAIAEKCLISKTDIEWAINRARERDRQ